jgi:hypothetical protein
MEKQIPNLLFVIPHYNNLKKLKRCVNSIVHHSRNLDQVFIIIIDDCSTITDKSIFYELKVVPKINIVYLDSNQGVSNARNVGINYAINNLISHISFIDCDDHLISDLQTNIISTHDLIVFESIETNDTYEEYYNYDNNIIKRNENETNDLNIVLQEYAVRPNKVMAIATCWGKIYSLSLIKQHNLFFNNKMSTYEDVDFLLRYLTFAKAIRFHKQPLYAHTNIADYTSLTFSKSGGMNRLFSFLKIAKTLKMLFNKYEVETPFNQYHFFACYYSITFIRLAIGIKNYHEFMELYCFIKKRISNAFVIKCFTNYDYKEAGGRRSIRWCVIKRLPLFLTLQLVLIARNRYKKEMR